MKELASEKVCLALGYFDSVHLGHRKILQILAETANKYGVPSAVSTFSNNAYKMFNVNDKQVYTYVERCELFEKLCDYVLPLRFDSRLKNHTATEFLDILFSRRNIAAVVCGYDYSFGKGAEGDAEMLASYCEKKNIECVVVPKFELDGERVSTSVVKEMLEKGDLKKANAFLGEPFRLSGRVVRGRGAGHMFDIPTANIKYSPGKLLPHDGVYGTTCEIDGKEYYSATNIGARPTFGLTKCVVETMIADFNDNIYGKEILLKFHEFLRPVSKFDTPAELSKQVHKDLTWYKEGKTK